MGQEIESALFIKEHFSLQYENIASLGYIITILL